MKLKKLFALALAMCMMVLAVPAAFAGEGFLTLEGSSREPVQQAEVTPSLMSTGDEGSGEGTGDTGNDTGDRVENTGVVTDKDVIYDADGNIDHLRLEAYVTGQTTTTTTTTTTPMDIVLVLDQSGSMAYDFSGNSTGTNADRRQYAMKQAVNNFIDEVAKQYNADTADHRMAIVTFGSSASTLEGWTFMNSDGQDALKDEINGLPDSPSGGTRTDDGMTQAQSLLTGTGYSYSGSNTDRQKVVILFTDGVPGQNGFDTGVATSAISTSKALKDAAVQVYAIGIFNGVDATQLYGEKWDFQYATDIPCTGEVGSYWGGSFVAQISGSNDFDFIDIAAGNRFLNYISSNFSTATEIGVQKGTFDPSGYWVTSGTGYKITKNFNRNDSNYYFTANNASSLNNIFKTISETIQSGSSSVQLDSTTTVTDVVSDYFKLPAGVDANNGINVYTAAYTKNGDWGADEPSSLKPTVSGNTVTVSGFDFSANYCDKSNGRQDAANPDKPGNFYGRKLIIEIPIEVADDFLGGENIPTNTTGSEIKNGNTVYEEFEPPTVNIPVDPGKVENWLDWDADITINSQTIYLSNEAVLNGMLTAKAGSKLDGVNNAFVDTVFTVKQDGTVIGTFTVAASDTVSEGTWAWNTVDNYGTSKNDSTKWAAKALTGCSDYIISCAIDNKPVSSTGVATVHVLKPTVTGISAHIKMGVEAPMAATYQWNTTCGCSGDTPAVTGSIPEVTYDYSKTEENKYPAVCTNYTVSAVIGGTKDAVSGQVTGGTLYTDINNVFTIHVHAPTLTGSVHNVKLGSSTVLDSNDVTLSWKETCITHTAAGSATGDPTPAYSFAGTATRENVTPVECTTYTVELIKIGEVTPASGTYTAPITVHVETPVIEGIDKTIYRGNETEVNAKISDWESCDCEGEIPNATGTPAAKYSFSGGDTVSPEECDEFTATLIKIGNLELEGTKYEDNITDNFLVHVLQPQITANDATIYFGTSIDLDGANELAGVMGGVQWINCCTELPGVSGTEPTPTYSFGVAGKDSYSPSDCTDLTAIWELDEEEFTDDFTVHVVKPAFTTSDTTIYRGNSTDLNSLVEVSNEWKCDRHSDIVLSYTNTPTISYVFEVDGEAVPSTYAPVNCEEVVTKPTIGNKTWNALDAFNVHVLQPTFDVTVQDVWADYTSTFDLTENCIASSVLVWKDMTTGHTTPNTLPADAPTVESSVFTFDKGANGSYTVGTKDDVITVPKMAFSLNNGYGADYTLTDKSSTVHVNKFDLTIEKTWKDGDKDADVTYKQDAIFNLYRVVTDAETGKPVDNLVTQVVLSAKDADGMIVIKDLLCGQNYKVEEQTNWTWRWKANVNGDKENTNVDSEDCSSHTVSASNPHDTTEGKTNPTAHGEKTATFINSLFNRLWLSFCTFVENVFAAMTSQKGGN